MIGDYFKYTKINNNNIKKQTLKICVEGNSDPMKDVINRIPV